MENELQMCEPMIQGCTTGRRVKRLILKKNVFRCVLGVKRVYHNLT